MANYRTPFYKIGMASTPLYQEKKDDYNPYTGEKITGESTTSIKTVINGRKGTLTTSRRNFESPGTKSTTPESAKPKMSNEEWTKFTKENPDWNKGGNRSAKKEFFTPDPEAPMELPKPAPVTFGNGLSSNPAKPIPVPVEEPGVPASFGGVNKARFEEKEEKTGNLFKTVKTLKAGCPGGCP